jgi:low temperature requirement protein LtrA
MNLNKRKLLTILSLELLLYSFLYLPVLILVMIGLSISEPTDPAQKLKTWVLIFGPPLLWLAMNVLMVRTLFRNARRDERTRETLRFGLGGMAIQAGIAAVPLVSLNLLTGLLPGVAAICGLVMAAMTENDKL